MMNWPKRLSVLILIPFCVSLLCAANGFTQDAPRPDNSLLKTVTNRLQTVSEIPIPQWHFLPGDDARGASPDLDDSGWQMLTLPSEVKQQSAWLRVRIAVPAQLNGYDIRGARMQLSLGLWGDDSFRVFVNGLPVVAGDESEPIPLTEHAVPGESLLIAIYVASYTGPIHMQSAKILLAAPANRPDPGFLRQEFLVADAMLHGLAPDDTDRYKVLQDALSSVDFAPLEHAGPEAFDNSLNASQKQLEALRPWMQQYSVHASGNSHIDMAWLWPWTETVDVVHRTFSSALQLMREFPDLTYTHSTAQAYEWMEEKYPDMFAEIQKRVKEGRWEVIGGMWVEPDLNMPDGESQVRQLLLGKRYFKEKFGVDIRTGWNPDSFGYNWQLPQIYKRSGVDFFVTQKMAWNDTTKFPYKLFWWESPDGSRVLTYFPHDYANPIDPVSIAKDVATYVPSMKYPDMLYLFGIGDHGGGPTRSMLETAEQWKQSAVYPKLSLGTVQPYFDQLEAKEPSLSLPVWKDELYFQYHRGVFTTQAETKKRARQNEALMLATEKAASFASLYGQPYPKDDLRQAWKKVLFNQFHDVAAGSGIADVYRDAARDFEQVHRIAGQHLQESLATIASEADTQGPGTPVLVFNPLSWKRTDIVEIRVQLAAAAAAVEVKDSRKHLMLSQVLSGAGTARPLIRFLAADIPSLGYAIFRVSAAKETRQAPSTLHAGRDFIENEFIRVRVDPATGCIISLFDKVNHVETIASAACGNELQAFVDKPKAWDAWNIDSDFEKQEWKLDQPDEVRLIENTPLRAVLRVRKHFQNSIFIQDITMVPHVPRVDVHMHADWHEKHILLKVAFPVAVQSNFATYEIPYGSIQRPTTRNTPEEKAKFEVPALRWADLSDKTRGLSVLNDSKYGYDGKGNVLRLSLLRSPEWPDPHADEGAHDFTYSLLPHAGGWKEAGTMQRGYELNYPLAATVADHHAGPLPAEYSFIAIQPNNLIITAVKQTEDGDNLLVRFYEFTGTETAAQVTVPAGFEEAFNANLMEQPGEKLPMDGKTVRMPVHPYEIRTVLLQRKSSQ